MMCENFCLVESKIFYEINYRNTNEGKNEIFKPRDFLIKFYDDYYQNTIGNYNRDIFYYINDGLKPIFLKNKLCVDQPKNFGDFWECEIFQYDAYTDNYKCIKWKYNLYFDTNKNSCIHINYGG